MKYSDKELKEMAKECIKARKSGDMRYLELLMQVSVKTGLDPNEVERRIKGLARN